MDNNKVYYVGGKTMPIAVHETDKAKVGSAGEDIAFIKEIGERVRRLPLADIGIYTVNNLGSCLNINDIIEDYNENHIEDHGCEKQWNSLSDSEKADRIDDYMEGDEYSSLIRCNTLEEINEAIKMHVDFLVQISQCFCTEESYYSEGHCNGRLLEVYRLPDADESEKINTPVIYWGK